MPSLMAHVSDDLEYNPDGESGISLSLFAAWIHRSNGDSFAIPRGRHPHLPATI